MEKSDFQRSTTPKNQSGQISTYTNYSSNPPHKIIIIDFKISLQLKQKIIQEYRKPTQSFEKLETKISSSSP